MYKGETFKNYRITRNGRVFGLYRKVWVKPMVTSKGYHRVKLSAKNGQIKVFVHRLVYETFVGRIPNGLQINHKDGIKANNEVNNLEVVTSKQNHAHAIKNKLRNPKHTNRRRKTIVGIRLIDGLMKEWNSIAEASIQIAGYLSADSNIIKAAKGQVNQAYGWAWEYGD